MVFRKRLWLSVLCFVYVGACTHAQAPEPVPPVSKNRSVPEIGADSGVPVSSIEEDENELQNTLKWTTASEVENFGFDIYRALSEEGSFERITHDPIAGAGTIDEPQAYVYKDYKIKAGVDYYYYIESISLAGVREIFSPVIRAPAKN